MQLERLVIETGDASTVLAFHPGLTVVTGVDALQRDRLVHEIVGALGSSRSGVHLEVAADSGDRYAFFRPAGGPHKAVNIGERSDMTGHFAAGSGHVSLLGRGGLDERAVLDVVAIRAADLGRLSEHDRRIHRLAVCDQRELVATAERLVASRERLDFETDSANGHSDDVETLVAAEERHTEAVLAHQRLEQRRHSTFVASGIAGLSAIPLVEVFGAWGVAPAALVATGSMGASLYYWRQQAAAHRLEKQALADAGAQSDLGLNMQRMNVLLAADGDRRKMVDLTESHRLAERDWMAIAGQEDVDWVLEHRAQIAEMARTIHALPAEGVDRRSGRATSCAYALELRLAEARALGHDGERFPALLDEPFSGLDGDEQELLLAGLLEASRRQQVVLFTDTARIESWARTHAATGEVGLIEPAWGRLTASDERRQSRPTPPAPAHSGSPTG